MPPPAPTLDLTLIVAATRTMGIGRNGTLPWTGLKREMAYFARVTKRPAGLGPRPTALNAVIMGRKDVGGASPPRFRPLKGRLNVVISRSAAPCCLPGAAQEVDIEKDAVKVASLEEAFECDAFFPLKLGQAEGWVKRDKGELDAWVGEEVDAGEQEENGTRYEFQMWEKEDQA
ncbi:dihydrofolate reductase [Verticillium alfalfae VaMs.102]|uniref:Dihydrofolate reductase n=1 Tax=Verticillium alfalfae (strain VaMs.102 / ATCC MYA-4576 / FGSC 10136) TaxID=526221 RepID=C9SV29_VERA1|nr:dihydrofolate reductase [Verticillium alfalfae VaMs.102]EEY22644.1 dihydrofolate reductase [Verticillium alfalfae VaMs.102]